MGEHPCVCGFDGSLAYDDDRHFCPSQGGYTNRRLSPLAAALRAMARAGYRAADASRALTRVRL